MKLSKIKLLLTGLLVILIGLQLFSIDKSAPETLASEDLLADPALPDDVQNLLINSCADCHSNRTTYPWYTSIQPLGWWIKGHIDHGRQNLNFSKWHSYDTRRKDHKAEECVEVLEQRRMPFSSYVMMHKEAQMTDAEYNRLIAYFESLRGSS